MNQSLGRTLCRAGPSTTRTFHPRRSLTTETFTLPPPVAATPVDPFSSPYSFSSTAIPSSSLTPEPSPANLLHPRKGWSIIEHVNSTLRTTYDPLSLGKTLFSRRHPDRLRTGSIVTVLTYNDASKVNFNSFSGILIATRHRGVDTSFRLRNIVNKVGVEMNYKVCSPMIKEIRVIMRAEGTRGTGKALGRNKAYWLRDKPELLAKIASKVKQARVEAFDAAGR